MSAHQRIWLVVNNASGSNTQDTVDALVAAMGAAGCAPERIVAIPDDPAPDRTMLEAGGVDILAVFTGDGTVNAVVTALYGWGGRVLVLPGGTQNLLAKALHDDRSADEIVALLGEGALTPVRRHLVRSSQGDGLCEVLAGPGAQWADVREAMREGDLGDVASTVSEAIGQSAGGATVRIGDPPLGKPEGYPAVRVHPQAGRLTVDGYGAETLADYALQGLALLRRDFREGPHDELGSHDAVVCRSDEPIELMIDGERMTAGLEERFETRECPVEFLAASGHPQET